LAHKIIIAIHQNPPLGLDAFLAIAGLPGILRYPELLDGDTYWSC